MPFFEQLLPEHLSTFSSLWLILFAGITSALTASLGVGGGVLLLAVMALVLPTAAIIPVHGLVQLGSNLNRALMTLKDIDWKLLAAFAPGTILGAGLASVFLVELPMHLLQITIASFILFLTWGPQVPAIGLGRLGTFFAAATTTFISMFAGATGPLVAAFVKQQQRGDRYRTVANFAAAMSVQHLPKAFVFGMAGFVFAEWLGLIVLMIASGALGTFLGLRLLNRLSNKNFGVVVNIILTLLALRLLWSAWVQF